MQTESFYLMAYITTIDLVQSDDREIEVTLLDSNLAASGKTLDAEDPSTFAPIDLTGGSVRLFYRKIGQTTLKDTVLGTITNATAGKVVFSMGASTLDTSGNFEGEIQFTDSTSKNQTVVDLIKFKVRQQLG